MFRELTDDFQVDEGFSFSMFVLDDDLVAALVGLHGVLQPVLCAVGGCVDVVFGQTQVVVQPVSLGLWVGAVGDGHDDGLPGVCDVALVCGLYLRHSWRKRREQRDTVRETMTVETSGCHPVLIVHSLKVISSSQEELFNHCSHFLSHGLT